MPYCNTESMNVFLEELSDTFSRDKIILACYGASWHKSDSLKIPENIELIFISLSKETIKSITGRDWILFLNGVYYDKQNKALSLIQKLKSISF